MPGRRRGARAGVDAITGEGARLAFAAVEKAAVGCHMLEGDGLSVPGTGTLWMRVSSPLSRFIASTACSCLRRSIHRPPFREDFPPSLSPLRKRDAAGPRRRARVSTSSAASAALSPSPISFPLELAGGAGGRALGAVLQPLGSLWERRHIDPGRPRPGEDAGDVEVGDGEIAAEQMGTGQ